MPTAATAAKLSVNPIGPSKTNHKAKHAMPNSFWPACTQAIQAHRNNNKHEAMLLLRKAESALDNELLDTAFRLKRQQHLESIKGYFRKIQSRQGDHVSQAVSWVDESLFFPRPLNNPLRAEMGINDDSVVIALGGAEISEELKEKTRKAADSLNQQGCAVAVIGIGNSTGTKTSIRKEGNSRIEVDAGKKDLPNILAAADILIFEGNSGGNSDRKNIRILECLALGRPLITLRATNTFGIVHKRDAYLIDKLDAFDIVNAIKEIKFEQGLATALAKGAVDFYLKVAAKRENGAKSGPIQAKVDIRQSKPVATQSPQAVAANSAKGSGDTIAVPRGDELQKLLNKIKKLEQDKHELGERLRSMPSIDPLCVNDSTFTWPEQDKEDFGIILFGHTRLDELEAVLESLKRQDALQYTEVWLDGYQGNHNLKIKIQKTIELVKKYPVKYLHTQNGNFGFRKMLILGLIEMCKKYRDILVLEDDCFPTRDAVLEFRKELDLIRNDKNILSVYGHHFLVEAEKETCARFQGWGWATTSEKLMPRLRQLIDCYSMTEDRYLKFVNLTLTPEIKARMDVTHPRQPSYTLEKFFAWDETLCLLSALNNQVHKPTKKRTIYNCGMGEGSTHFDNIEEFRLPPFNLITLDEVWRYF